jgi:hypothetical protein
MQYHYCLLLHTSKVVSSWHPYQHVPLLAAWGHPWHWYWGSMEIQDAASNSQQFWLGPLLNSHAYNDRFIVVHRPKSSYAVAHQPWRTMHEAAVAVISNSCTALEWDIGKVGKVRGGVERIIKLYPGRQRKMDCACTDKHRVHSRMEHRESEAWALDLFCWSLSGRNVHTDMRTFLTFQTQYSYLARRHVG